KPQHSIEIGNRPVEVAKLSPAEPALEEYYRRVLLELYRLIEILDRVAEFAQPFLYDAAALPGFEIVEPQADRLRVIAQSLAAAVKFHECLGSRSIQGGRDQVIL